VCLKLLTLPNDSSITNLDKEIEITTADLNSHDALNLLCMDCQVVFHVAGKAHSVPRTKEEEEEFNKVNVAGTMNLLEAAKKNRVKRVVFYSTVGVYGREANFHGDELSPCQPGSVYAKSKYEAEKLALGGRANGGPEGVVLRFPVVYGPCDRGNVAALIKSIHKRYFFYLEDGKAVRSMISARNAAEAAYRAAFEPQAAGQVFCVTDGRDYKLGELVEAICQALGISWRQRRIPLSFAEVIGKLGDLVDKGLGIGLPVDSDKVRKLSRSLTFSCEKARRVLGYEPVETLEEGIRREVEWLYAQIASRKGAKAPRE
jgi:nucleoside-diphosphate-sugar epimerase